MPSPEFPSLSRWVLTLVKLPYLGTKKMNLFKMLDFQRIHFSRKGLENEPPLFAQLNCESKSFEPDHQILSQCPIQRFLIVITHFFGSLKFKKKRWLFRNNKLSLKIFWFQVLRKPCFENKGNFWKIVFTSKHSHHGILSRRHLHSLHTQGAFTS